MSREPAAIVGLITALVSAVLVFLESFGVNLTDEQSDSIRGIVAVVAPLIAAFVIRSFVVSPASAGEAVAIAKQEPAATNVIPEIKVGGYKQAVVDNLPATVDERTIKWRPKVSAQG
jgi:hypothetical protein